MDKEYIISTIDGQQVAKEVYFKYGLSSSTICHYSDIPIVTKGNEYRIGVVGLETTIKVRCTSIIAWEEDGVKQFTYIFKHI